MSLPRRCCHNWARFASKAKGNSRNFATPVAADARGAGNLGPPSTELLERKAEAFNTKLGLWNDPGPAQNAGSAVGLGKLDHLSVAGYRLDRAALVQGDVSDPLGVKKDAKVSRNRRCSNFNP